MKYVLPWSAFFFLLSTALIFPIQDGDIFMYLAIARESLALGQIPTLDPFLYTIRDWHILHEWLSYFLWYGAYGVGGYTGVILFNAGLWIFTFFWIPFQNGLRKSTGPLNLLILFLAAKACSHRFIEKSSLFSDLLSVVVLCALMQKNSPWKKWRWVFPILFLLAVNLHPGFVIGLALLWIYLFFEIFTQMKWPQKEILQTIFLSTLACLVNPLFVQGILYPFHTVLKEDWDIYRKINFEWLPTFTSTFVNTWEVRSLIVLIILIAGLLILETLRHGKKTLFVWSVFGVFLYLAISANRFITTSSLGFSVLGVFLGNDYLKIKNLKIKNLKINNVLTMGIGIFFFAGAVSILNRGYSTAAGPRKFKFGVDEMMMPVAGAHALKLRLQSDNEYGRIFNDFGWGSYLAWELNISNSLFIHGHIDDPQFLNENYYSIGHSQEDFDQTMMKHQIRYLFLDIEKLRGNPPPKLLSFLGDWDLVYRDAWSVILKKKVNLH